MKKTISLFLSILMIMTSVSWGLVSYAIETENEVSIYDFADDLSELLRKYSEQPSTDKQDVEDVVITVDKFFSGMNINEDISTLTFETKRLIVKSEQGIDYHGAVDCVSGYDDLYILQYDSVVATKTAYEYYSALESVEYVEPDIIMTTQNDIEVPDDFIPEIIIPDGDASASEIMDWLSDKIGFNDIKESLAERIEDDYILVATIDSGADTDHDLLKDRVINSGVNFSGTGVANSCEDDYGHGTHVAGIIAANTLDNVKIKPYKVLNDEGKGSLSAIAVAVDMAVEDGADIINLSLTAKGESARLTEAIDNATAQNVNVVVAAGNNKSDLDKIHYTPACIESAITVSATDKNDKLASFSNYDGPIDIAAPGTEIKSSYLNNAYAILSGTSMAAPQVAAGLAIIKTVFPDFSASECEDRVEEYTIKLFENPGENHFGAGLLFLKYLLDEKPTTANPVLSVGDCTFSKNFQLEITCPEEATIYYALGRIGDDDFTNWFDFGEYTQPITISVDTMVVALAVAKGKNPSEFVTASYDRAVDKEEDNYEINTLGYITAYYGNETYLIVPEKIDGKTVKGIASSAFEGDFRIKSVILPDSAIKINSKAFKGCTALSFVAGNGVTEISTSAFEGSSIDSFSFPEVTTIGYKAFSECSKLTSMSMPKVEAIGDYSFQKTPELLEISLETAQDIGVSAFAESGIQSVDLPNATTVGMNAFSDCENLVTVSVPQLTELSLGVFKNCTGLKNIDMPLLTNIGANSFRNTGLESYFGRYVERIGNYAFAESSCLASVFLPLTEFSGTNAFADCTDLQVAMLPAMTELNNNSFYNCTKLKMLYLPAVKTVSRTAFLESSIEYLRFNCVEEIKSLPETLKGIVLPSSLTSITASAPDNDFIVYGYENTYAHEYAVKNNKEFHTVPAILYETTGEVNPDDTYIVIYAMGFDCTYQWYKNDKISNVGGTPIDGANYFYYEPKAGDNAVAYYCVITSSDGVNINSVVTNPITNLPEYRPADLTEYNKVVEEVSLIDRENVDEILLNELDDLLSLDLSKLTYDNQYLVDSIVEELEFVLYEIEYGVLLGDVNHDHKVSAYDARIVLRFAADTINLSRQQQRIADMNGDGQVTAIDARLILIQSIET